MTWTARILAILNVIAAIVLFYAAGRCAYQRAAWTKFLEERAAKYRDGMPTADWLKGTEDAKLAKLLDNMAITPALLEKLPQADRTKLERLEQQAKAQNDALKARGAGQNVPHRYRSESEQRLALGKSALPDKGLEDPGTLLLDQAGIKEMREKLGPAGFIRLIREAILLNKPKIFAEERDLAEKLASLLRTRENYTKDIERFNEEITRLEARLKDERGLREKLDFENKARRDEITQLYAEVEEALHARDVAQAHETDMRRQLAEVQDRIAKLSAKNAELESVLLQKEGVTKKD